MAKTLGLLLLALTCVSAGCTTFRGPGNLQTPEYSSDQGEWHASTNEAQHKYGDSPTDIAFDWPVDEARLTQAFNPSGARAHWGIDIANNRGTPVLASEKGYVIYTGHEFRGYGNLIVIEHSPDWATLYSHLDKITVKEGQWVRQGEEIGKMGRTGRATGVHLHFEIRHNRQPVNPQAYLPPGM